MVALVAASLLLSAKTVYRLLSRDIASVHNKKRNGQSNAGWSSVSDCVTDYSEDMVGSCLWLARSTFADHWRRTDVVRHSGRSSRACRQLRRLSVAGPSSQWPATQPDGPLRAGGWRRLRGRRKQSAVRPDDRRRRRKPHCDAEAAVWDGQASPATDVQLG